MVNQTASHAAWMVVCLVLVAVDFVSASPHHLLHHANYQKIASELESEYSPELDFVSAVKPPLYAIEVPNTAIPDIHGAIFRSPMCVGPELMVDRVTTAYENFNRAVKFFPNSNFLGHRPAGSSEYVWRTYADVAAKRDAIASGLQSLGLVVPNDAGLKVLGIYSANRPEWVIFEQALYTFSGIPVPLYDTLGQDAAAKILQDVQMTSIVCSVEKAGNVATFSVGSNLQNVIFMENAIPDSIRAMFEALRIQVFTMDDIETAGMSSQIPHRPPAGRDIATFCFTSGTVGDSKGVLLTHTNMVSDFAAVSSMSIPLQPCDVHLSYLPLAHMLERMTQFAVIHAGGSIGFYSGDVKLINQDLRALRPTVFPTVPRILNRFRDSILAIVKTKKPEEQKFFHAAIAGKIKDLENGILESKDAMTVALFNEFKAGLGLDRLRFMLVGSAPITASVLQFHRALFSVPIIEAFGQTEATAASTITFPDDFSVGHVGGPIPANEITLFDVPELGYLSTDTEHVTSMENIPCIGRGEIAFRGTNVMAGYYKLDRQTSETIDADGWLHTGDIALIMPNGAVKIIDRKKNIFKLSQGEYIAPEKLENIYSESLFISQIFVYGNPVESELVAIVIPDIQACSQFAKSLGALDDSIDSIVYNPDVQHAIRDDINRLAAANKLAGFEVIKAFYVDSNPFSVENGLLTPTFKLKRQAVKAKYEKILEKLYRKLKPDEVSSTVLNNK